jgi:large subunit ribosomal protein L22
MKAYAKNIRISPKKMQPVVHVVRGMKAKDALDILKFMPKKGADLLYKVIYSAVSNAQANDNQELNDLTVGTIVINKGIVYKRGHAISRGRYHKNLKRTSNILVELIAQ